MFSRREREYLRLLADRPLGGGGAEERFPNPVYRRKLAWAVRRKAAAAIGDWELYCAAARHSTGVRLAASPGGEEAVPVFADPIVVAWRRLRASVARGPGGTPTRRRRRPGR